MWTYSTQRPDEGLFKKDKGHYFFTLQYEKDFLTEMFNVDWRFVNMSYLLFFEALCYLSALSSALIAKNTLRIQNKTFISKFFAAYFIIDSIMGCSDAFLLFKLKNERFDKQEKLKCLTLKRP